jgi:hypothetical protein
MYIFAYNDLLFPINLSEPLEICILFITSEYSALTPMLKLLSNNSIVLNCTPFDPFFFVFAVTTSDYFPLKIIQLKQP